MLIVATVITAEGDRVRLAGICSRSAMEQIIDGTYPDARRVSIIVYREKGAP